MAPSTRSSLSSSDESASFTSAGPAPLTFPQPTYFKRPTTVQPMQQEPMTMAPQRAPASTQQQSEEQDLSLRGGQSDRGPCPGRFCFCIPCPIPCNCCIIPIPL